MKPPADMKNLKRSIQPMPDAVAAALRERKLEVLYLMRPAYQRNDYLSWINRAVHEATKNKHLALMLIELERGDIYMGMAWKTG